MRNGTPAVFLATTLALSAGNAAAAPYTFTNIVEGNLSDLNDPSFNDSGTVAFAALGREIHTGIFTGSGGPITTLYDESGPFNDLFFLTQTGTPSLNDNGTVAFVAGLDVGGEGIFTGSGRPPTTIVDTSGPFANVSDPSLNNSGTVAFRGQLDAGGQGIFTGAGGAITTIADSSGPFTTFVVAPDINDSGTVAFVASLDVGGQGIFTGSGGAITTIADRRGPFDFFIPPVGTFFFISLNNSDTVAFWAHLDRGGQGIFTGSGGPITTIADSSGPFQSFSKPVINDSGTLAFAASLDAGAVGLFIGPDPLTDEVIRLGDPLFGSTLRGLELFDEGLNNSGQIAFRYFLDDGRIGIARADPLVTPVPEPGTLGLLAAGLLGAVLSGRRPRRGGLKAPSTT